MQREARREETKPERDKRRAGGKRGQCCRAPRPPVHACPGASTEHTVGASSHSQALHAHKRGSWTMRGRKGRDLPLGASAGAGAQQRSPQTLSACSGVGGGSGRAITAAAQHSAGIHRPHGPGAPVPLQPSDEDKVNGVQHPYGCTSAEGRRSPPHPQPGADSALGGACDVPGCPSPPRAGPQPPSARRRWRWGGR